MGRLRPRRLTRSRTVRNQPPRATFPSRRALPKRQRTLHSRRNNANYMGRKVQNYYELRMLCGNSTSTMTLPAITVFCVHTEYLSPRNSSSSPCPVTWVYTESSRLRCRYRDESIGGAVWIHCPLPAAEAHV